MELLNDKELDALLRQWEAPHAPGGLTEKFFPRGEPLSRWRWLWCGSIRVPVPVGMALCAMRMLSVLVGIARREPPAPPVRPVTLSDFQPVQQLQPRIIRSENDTH